MRALLHSLHAKVQSLDGETDQIVRMVSAACAVSGARVLDVGCGYGRLLSLLQAAGLEATGVDMNPNIVAAGRNSGLRCVTPDEFNASSDQYDVVLMSHVIEHLS